ncbi:MAG: YhjD/YihY/BrkB family envelope integrity protein [Myxococcaceae bacterium]
MDLLIQRLEERLAPVWVRAEKYRAGRFARDIVRAVFGLLHGFRGEQVTVRAAALTFISLFSLIPLLTVGLGLLRVLRQQQIQLRVQKLVHDVLDPGVREGTAAFLDHFISTATSTTVSGIGAIGLLVSAGSLIHNLDESINTIWHVRSRRRWYVQLGLYLAVLFGGPLVVGLSLSATSIVRRFVASQRLASAPELFWIGGLIVTVTAMTALYILTPATRVKFRSALAGGLVAGLAWDIAKHVYAEFAQRSFQWNPVYGSLGALPLFLLWIYVSWIIVLSGARLAYAVQHATYRGVILDLERHPRARELVAARVAQLITTALLQARRPPRPRELAATLQVPDSTINEIVELMVAAGLITRIKGGGLRPSRSPQDLTLADVAGAVGGIARLLPRSAEEFAKAPEFQDVEALFQTLDDASLDRLRTVTWESLTPKTSPPRPAEPVPAATGSGKL